MKNGAKPMRLFLTRETFNTLISALDYFIRTEKVAGKTFYSVYSERLKAKVIKHSRTVKNRNEEQVLILFYETETAILIKILLKYFNLGEEN